MGKVVTVTAEKGGTGKSACLIHIAHGLHIRGKSVLILDTDETPTLKNGYDDRMNYMDLDIIPESLANNYPLVKRIKPVDPIDKVLEVGRRKYDYVFIDTQGKLGTFEAELISKSDFVVMVVGANDLELDESFDVVKVTNSIAKRHERTLPIIGILQRVDPRDLHLNDYIRDRVLEEAYGLKSFMSNNALIKVLEGPGFTAYDAIDYPSYMTKILKIRWKRDKVATISKQRASDTIKETEAIIDELLEEIGKYE